LNETPLFKQFLVSSNTLWAYKGDKLLFISSKHGLQPLFEYVDKGAPFQGKIKIFDKVVGNAAALLMVKAKCKEIYSPLASELALKTLRRYNIQYHIHSTTPYIQNREGEDMCPMEKLSLAKNPEEFYTAARPLLYRPTGKPKAGHRTQGTKH